MSTFLLKRVFVDRWHAEGGYREVINVSLPIAISMASSSLMHFVDRIFLSHYSQEAIAASLPAGAGSWVLICFFFGTTGYCANFVAQYIGAKQNQNVGRIVWQAIYASIAAAVLLLIFYPLAGAIFTLIGHPAEVRVLEIDYFKILILGAGFAIAGNAISGFYSGRKMTWTVMKVNLIGNAVNVFLNYALIFGHLGMPEMGIKGAGIGTVTGQFSVFIVFLIMFLHKKNEASFCTLSGRRFDGQLMLRLFRFGMPSGAQFFIDMLGFTFFIFFIGRIGKIELAASNIVFSINALIFMPMLGFSLATSVLVGQSLGNDNTHQATFCTVSSFHLTMVYMSIVALLFILMPEPFIKLFQPAGAKEEFQEVVQLGAVLLRLIALYSFFDSIFLISGSALRGSGDTRFLMIVSATLVVVALILPSILMFAFWTPNIYVLWGIVLFCWWLTAVITYIRYRSGKWKCMRVIETVQ